jgi:adenosine 3'-phospho 5'-phosphosulfate transporter B2
LLRGNGKKHRPYHDIMGADPLASDTQDEPKISSPLSSKSSIISVDDGKPEIKPATPETLPYNVRLGLSVFGIMGFFLLYGVLQERIMTTPYGEDAEGNPVYFEETTFLVLSNRVFAAFVACVVLIYKGQSLKNAAPLHKYLGVSASNFSATWCQYEALKYVNFPTQTLGKCGKMFPVMIVGTFISGKKYSFKDYGIALSITLGCVLFLLTGDISSKDTSNTPIGLLLMALYMFFDGFTSTAQEKMFKGYTMSTYDQMIYVNLFSALISVVILIGKGTLMSSIQFSLMYPSLLSDSIWLSVCSTFGQMLIYYTIKEFGALFFSTVMVTRQVFSILLSCIIYFHPLSNGQWFGFLLVFGTLYYKAMEDKKKHSSGGRH